MPFPRDSSSADAPSTVRQNLNEFVDTFKFWRWTLPEFLIAAFVMSVLSFLGFGTWSNQQQAQQAATVAQRVEAANHAIDLVVAQQPVAQHDALTSFQACYAQQMTAHTQERDTRVLPMALRADTWVDAMRLVWRPCAMNAVDEARQHRGTTVAQAAQATLDAMQAPVEQAWNAVPTPR